MRLIRLLKIFKAYQEKKRREALERFMIIEHLIKNSHTIIQRRRSRNSMDAAHTIERENVINQQKEQLLKRETRIGNKMLENTVKRAVSLVLLLVFCMPVFFTGFFYENPRAFLNDFQILSHLARNSANSTLTREFFEYYVKSYENDENPLISCEIPSQNLVFLAQDAELLRPQEKEISLVNINGVPFMWSAVDLRPLSHLNSTLNILRTLYISFFLLISCVLFQKDVETFVIEPLSRMVANINRLANNPLNYQEDCSKTLQKSSYETDLIDEAIRKIGVLLALGFGEAGSSVISQNISNECDLEVMLPGKKVFGVFGFCDIRNFTDTTEVLQEEVMVFVNSIAEVVHSFVNKYAGAANKNIGDAFLLVWKYPETELFSENGAISAKKSRVVKNLTDLSLIAFLKILCGIKKSQKLSRFSKHERLQARLHNYEVKMGFGLHVGWAIEGSIGSIFKIDASYLSPNVNMASRLEAATKQYNALILMSSDFMGYASKKTKKFCREIDRVTVKGSFLPVGLFTIDISPQKLEITNYFEEVTGVTSKKQSIIERRSIKQKATNFFEKMNYLLDHDKELISVLKLCGEKEFRDAFSQGFQLYVEGNWEKARNFFEISRGIREKDGPCRVLLQFIEEFEGKAPSSWKGYRVLNEK